MVPKFEKRVIAYATDISAVAIAAIIAGFGLGNLIWAKVLLVGVAYLGFSIIPYFFSKGQSFGKRIQKIKIVKLDGTDANVMVLIGREVFKTVLSLGTFGLYSIIAYFALTEKETSRTIHDFIFKTKAIDLEKPKRRNRDDNMIGTTDSLRKRGL